MSDKPTVRLIGSDGNIFMIMALCQRAARSAGWDKNEIDTFLNSVKNSKSYDNALAVVMDNFEVI